MTNKKKYVRKGKSFLLIIFLILILLTNLMEFQYSLVTNLTPTVMRSLFHDLTRDMAVSSNSKSKQLDEHLQQMFELQDLIL